MLRLVAAVPGWKATARIGGFYLYDPGRRNLTPKLRALAGHPPARR